MTTFFRGWKTPGAAVLLFAVLCGFTWTGDDFFYKMNKGIDVYGRVYREVAVNYVDEIEPMDLMESGIDGMLSSLDPYTNFINDEEGDEVDLITTGRYGGIGVTIGVRDGEITVMTVMEGYSAQRQGMQPGDRIVEIDGKKLSEMKPSEVRVLTRGTPGTEVRLSVERNGEDEPLEFILLREEIRLRNVSYSDLLDDGIGYIRLERFSREAGNEIAIALKEMRLRGTVHGIILDLRNNPGGLLDAAVDVVEKFVPKGSLIVSTRGRKPESERKYFSKSDPVVPDLPLVVVVNNNSASASEIVAAAVQDLDRGIILGTRSFGKGLVQTVTPLIYNTQIKMTTAKYYTPSGRCLQEIDYSRGGGGDTVENKKKYMTLRGRSEFGNGGVQPDTVVAATKRSDYYASLMRQSMFFRFASQLHREADSSAMSDGKLIARFREFLDGEDFVYTDGAENLLEDLIGALDSTGRDVAIINGLVPVREMLKDRSRKALTAHAGEVLTAVRVELRGLEGGEKKRIAASLEGDVQIASAVDLILNGTEYTRRLTLGMKSVDEE